MAHTHEGEESYFLDQVFTIALCGALSACAIILYVSDRLFFLATRFRGYVLVGGVALGVMVVIRAIAVWQQAGKSQKHDHDNAHDHEHEHDHDHDHDHHHDHDHSHDHAHEHEHEHGWAPWRYMVLLIPVVMYFLQYPNDVQALAQMDALDVSGKTFVRSDREIPLTFTKLEAISRNARARAFYEGKRATLVGKFVPTSNPNQFQLVRFKMRCCAADALPINAVLMIDPKWDGQPLSSDQLDNEWVKVTGHIQFFEIGKGTGEYASGLVVFPNKDKEGEKTPNDLVRIIEQPLNPFIE